MAEYRNVFKEDAQRQLERERSKPRAKPRPKPSPKKRPPSTAPTQAKPLRATKPQPSNSWVLDPEERKRLESGGSTGPKVQSTGLGAGKGFSYAGPVQDAGSIWGRVARGAASNLTDVVTGIPSLAVLGARTAAYPYTKAAGLAGVGGARDFSSDTEGLLADTGRAIAQDYNKRWGPLFRGDINEFGQQAADNPLFLLGDLALGKAVVGSAAGAGARAVARAAPATRVGQTAGRIGDRAITPGHPRYREPRRLVRQMGENTGKGRKGPATNAVEIRRRPYSSDPLTRVVQKRVVDPLVDKATARMDRSPDSPVARAVGTRARYQRRAARAGRDLRRGYDLERGKVVRQEAGELQRLSRGMNPEMKAALYLHTQDLLDVPGMTPAEARANVVRMMEEGNRRMVEGGGVKDKKARANIAAIANIPDKLLDLATAPPKLRDAVEQARALGQSATERRIAAGTLTEETARAAAQRPGLMAHGEMRWDPQAESFTSPTRTDVGANATYLPDVPVDRLAGRGRGGPSGAFGRLTLEKDRQNKGVLFGSGNVSMDPNLSVRALERAIADELHPRMMREFEKQFVFRRADGKKAKGRDAILKMEADPDAVALISAKSLDDARRRVENMPEGQLPENPLEGLEVYEGADGLTKARSLTSGRGQLVAVSKAALDGLRQGWAPTVRGGKLGTFYDNPLSMWKRGILTFAPRWYVNNAFGNTLQFGLLTGGDVRSLLQAKRSRAGEAIPERVAGGVVEQTRVEAASFRGREPTRARERFEKASDFGFRVNHVVEGLIRRGAYISRVKKGLRNEGMRGRDLRKMSDQELMDAIDNAPREVKEQALREVELFLGDYVRLNPFEQNILRRVFPWYSWMRVIGRLMLGLPFRHPKRAVIGSLVAEAAGDVVNPEDDLNNLPLYDRGRVKLPGGLVQRTSSLNPFTTHLELASELLDRDPAGVTGSLVRDISPFVAPFAQLYSGKNAFGDPFSHPAGYGGTVESFGQLPMRIDPATGRPEPVTIAPPLDELALQTIPLVPGILRAIGSRGRQPYDTARTLDLLLRGKPNDELFWPDRGKPQPTEPVNPIAQPFLSIAGANIRRRNPEAEKRRAIEEMRRLREAARQTRRRKARARARES